MVKENLEEVEQRIAKACKRADRNPKEITLIAVSKTKPVELIREALDYGIMNFGENKVQELMTKQEQLKEKEIQWHMIGHLQTNKVKYIVDNVSLIHSVDSLHLAEQISKEAEKKGVICNILVEVNVSEEETKFGVKVEETLELVTKISKLSHIRVKGLMTIAPFVENFEENRLYFRKLRKLNLDIKSKNIDNVSMDILSMGMTGDYEVAIEEGATMVRVGTGIFGERRL